MHKLRVSRTLIGGLRAYGGVGKLLKSLKSMAVTDPLIPGHFGQYSLGEQPRQDLDLFRSWFSPRQCIAKNFAHSDRWLACIWWREKAQVDKNRVTRTHGYRPFRSVLPRCATESRLRAVPKFIQSKAMYKPRVSRTLIGGLRAYGGVGSSCR